MLYRYVPFKMFEKTCSQGNNNGWSDVYQDGRTRALDCRPQEDPYLFCYRENR